jgi:hypothetical protein
MNATYSVYLMLPCPGGARTTRATLLWLAALIVSFPLCHVSAAAAENALSIEQVVEVAPVWSGHQVDFALLTRGQQQLTAFYDAAREMTVGLRRLDSTKWHFVRLPLKSDALAHGHERLPVTKLGWDSHNSVTLAVDGDGQIHLSGNMHAVPLIYFRTTRPMDIDSFRWSPEMTGRREKKATYPQFIIGPQGELIFTYRDGGSGNGDQIFNLYDLKTHAWGRLFAEPLFGGGGKMNAYFTGPVRDRAGIYHICWVWRDTPDCATNHDICYVQSADLVHWRTSDGKPLALPITIKSAEIVDPVPSGNGVCNGDTRIGFDSQGRVVIAYYKFDAHGNTQIYNARREQQGWRIYRTSDWDYRWDLHGGGAIQTEIHVEPVILNRQGQLTQGYRHIKYGKGTWLLDEATLKPLAQASAAEIPNSMRAELGRVESQRPNMQVRLASDLGRADEPRVRYLLRWETLPPNRDRPYPGEPPPPSMLRVYKLRTSP